MTETDTLTIITVGIFTETPAISGHPATTKTVTTPFTIRIVPLKTPTVPMVPEPLLQPTIQPVLQESRLTVTRK